MFLYFLQADPKPVLNQVTNRLPTFSDLVSTYGAFLTFVLIAVITICLLQHNWFNKLLKSKDEQIKRLDEKEKEIYKRLLDCIDQRR
jgi:hypothetical protein